MYKGLNIITNIRLYINDNSMYLFICDIWKTRGILRYTIKKKGFKKEIMYKYTLRAIPTSRYCCDRQYNQPPTGNCSTDPSVGMAYLLGYWPTDRRMIVVAGRRGGTDLYQACLIFHCRLIARRWPSPSDGLHPSISRRVCQSSSGYGPL